ncbi:hypothetical protein C8J56DRAFT_1170759 [Mycena floridula]|nr:hypothetical protein C8J56DRAFT_1170759 [Mycena floridula]
MFSLEKEREMFEKHLDGYETLLSPIPRILPEILRNIFTSSISINDQGYAHALSTQELWSNIVLDGSGVSDLASCFSVRQLQSELVALSGGRGPSGSSLGIVYVPGMIVTEDLDLLVPNLRFLGDKAYHWTNLTVDINVRCEKIAAELSVKLSALFIVALDSQPLAGLPVIFQKYPA